MNKLTSFSMKNVAAILIICAILFGAGGLSAVSLKQETMPDISLPLVFVTTVYTAPPRDVMEDVSKPLEKAIAGAEGVKKIHSTSSDNFSMIQIELANGRKPEDAKQDIESLLANVKLPQKAEKPQVLTFGFGSIPVYNLAISGKNGMSQEELDRIFNDIFEPTLGTLSGLDHVDAIGNQEALLKLKLDLNAILNYGLTPNQVSQSIQASIVSSPAGSVKFGGNNQMVRINSDLDSLYGLENMKLTTPTGDTVLLKQIAKVEAISESTFLSRLNGEPAIAVSLFKTKEANTVQFSAQIDKLVEQWKAEYPDVSFTTIMNQAVEVKKSINGMLKEGAIGAFLAAAMILLFLRNMRMTLIVLVSIPLSVLLTLLVMNGLDISLNIMTLGGLTIAIGRVVDDSIVVIENIYSELQKSQNRNESVIKLATARVASAITSSTITTVGVFAPISFVGGILGDIFRPFAITLVVSLLASLLVALTVIPMLAKLLVLNSDNVKHHESADGKFMSAYKRLIGWALANPKKTVLTSVLLLVVTVGGTVPFLGSEFIPESLNGKDMQFSIRMQRETSFETMDAKVKEIEALLAEQKDPKGEAAFTYIESMVGYDNSDDRVPYKSVVLASSSEASNPTELVKETEAKIAALLPSGSEVTGNLTATAGMGTGEDFAYLLKGDDLLQLEAGAALIKEKMREFPELSDIKDSLSEKKTEVEVKVDQNKARLYGLTAAQVLESVSSWLSEVKFGEYRFDNTVFRVTIMLDDRFKDSLLKLGQFQIRTPTNMIVNLTDVAQVRQTDAPSSITRENQEQYVKISASIDSRNKGGVSNQVSEALKSVSLPNGIRTETQGVNDDIQSSIQQMMLAMAAAICIVYLVMVLAFGNASAPFVILFSLPLAAIGGFLGLFLTGQTINVTSLIGFLMLIGVVVTNAIVLIDRVQQNEEAGMDTREALIEAGMSRFRPIIMTAGATIVAMLPMALGFSEGALISKGLSVVVIGGLTTSTVLTLVVVPVMYELITNIKKRLTRKRRTKPGVPSGPAAPTH
ncbi:efflux RND transporter permease subunit [Paenibacillus hodogayensis]|uniref:Efflux RND transporter permease subunit n=1 Tax=Paenibacillus hodogayensis TaxID=279208 RepID=A0ABV5VPP8_9BACL